MHARDAIAQQQIERELCYLKDHVAREQGYQGADVLSQDDGLMVGLLTVWTSRDDARHFHDSGLNQLLMAVTELRITGTPVVKLFRIID
jgi:heme-degrading monooxygenase HmoA